MSLIKKLAGDTAVYGLSSVLGKVLNYLLVPLYTAVFAEGEYGIISELYAYTAFVMIVLLYRMETAYFRFGAQKEGRSAAYDTALSSIILSTLLFSVAFVFLAGPFGDWIKLRPEHQPLLYLLVAIWGFDVLSEIPYARLRMEGRAWRFASIKLTNIGINIGLNLFFLLACPAIIQSEESGILYRLTAPWYDPEFGIGYVFVANLVASFSAFLLLFPQWSTFNFGIDKVLWNKMMVYSSPLIIAGLAGITNEMLDRVLLKHLLPFSLEENERQLGIYSACYKLAVFMALFTQAFRYAAEPFFFQHARNVKAPDLYAAIGKYFVIAGLLAFLVITLYLDIFKLLLRREGYREGLDVVPILLMANLFLGLFYNLSVWFKLTDKTIMATWLGLGGAAITIGLNLWWIPVYGYMGSAWATFICYGAMAAASYFIGRNYYRLPYDWRSLGLYTTAAVSIYLGYEWYLTNLLADLPIFSGIIRLLIIAGFLLWIWIREKDNIRNLIAVK